jgi:hypothetical protein
MSNDQETAAPIGKISTGAQGLGTVTPEMVEDRAREIALADGRTEANEADRQSAYREVVPDTLEPTAPELDSPELENVTEWDTAPEEKGTAAPTVLPEDEANIAETLVQEGLEEADHTSRVEAAETFPPEEV